MSKKNTDLIATRLAERKFRKWKAVKRNKDIFDIDEVDIFEGAEQKKRRTPFRTLSTDMSQKFSESFMNSTAAVSFKLASNIQKHRSKFGNSLTIQKSITRSVWEEPNQKQSSQPRGVSMQKMITRQYRQSLDYQEKRDESRYNNFKLTEPQSKNVRSFEKYLSRQYLEKLDIQEVPASNPEVPSIYQKFFFPSTTFNANWQYKKQKEPRGPIFFKLTKQNSSNLNQINYESIQNGSQRCSAHWNKTLTNFRSLSTKDNPAQFERTFYPPNMNFRTKRPKMEENNKSVKIKTKVTIDPQFNRCELCDIKFFRLKTGKQKRINRFKTQ